MSAAAEFFKSTAKGDAAEFPPGIAHGSNANAFRRPDNANGITRIWLNVVRGVPADHLVFAFARIKNHNLTFFYTRARANFFKPFFKTAPHLLLPPFYFSQSRHIMQILLA